MFKIRYKTLIKLIFGVVLASDSAPAVTLPSRMPMLMKTRAGVDQGLEAWMAANVVTTPVAEMTSSQVLAWSADKNPVTRALILLETRKVIKPVFRGGASVAGTEGEDKELAALEAKNLTEVPQIIQAELAKPASERSPLLAELYLVWKASKPTSENMDVIGTQIMAEEPRASCASKKNAIKLLTRERIAAMSDEQLIQAVNVATDYKSLSQRRRYLENLATSLPVNRRQAVVEPLRTMAKDLPLLARRFSWLNGDDEAEAREGDEFLAVGRSIARKNCSEAEKLFLKSLGQNLAKSSILRAVAAGTEIERCYRSVKRNSAGEFWTRISVNMEARYGKEGALWSKVRKGYIEWVSGDFMAGLKTYEEIFALAQPAAEYRAILAKSTYILAKIAEDQGQVTQATNYFKDYVRQFPDQEDFEFALNGVVVNLAMEKKWEEMIVPLSSFLNEQEMIHIDRRQIGTMAFSLFWLGRAHLQTGHPEIAREMWRRLAAEYYSTFYGALGHYLLEQVSGQSFAIEPSRVNGFDFAKMRENLSAPNQAAVTRTFAFLQAGILDSARCELEEVVATSPTDFDTQTMKSLLLHATGAWLDAIKIFDAIPRSVRGSLPVGFERVLFPRKYAEIVKKKSAKLTVDPDFVFALMRQESVFAKDATSPVGAMGLMQLMPTTARLEATKLSRNYIDSSDLSDLRGAMGDPASLRDPDVNVTLGVHHLWRLMTMYKSPVFALTAYNASPAATQKWRRSMATDDWLTFIERIPYKETRSYVKLILRNYFYYNRWYNPTNGKSQTHIDTVLQDMIALAREPAPARP